MKSPNNTAGLEGRKDVQTTPYTRSEAEMNGLLEAIIDDPTAIFIDKTTNPEIGDFSVYCFDGADERADIGRTLEAKIFNGDAGYEPEFIQENFEDYDNNSIFLILVDNQDAEAPKAVGALRIIDCLRGGSETVSMFNEFYGDTRELPTELQVSEKDKANGLWDILTIVMEPEYRDGVNSAWLYHGLYTKALQGDIARMIANMTPNEARNITEYIGIPFQEIEGAEPVQETAPNGKESIYGFYSLDMTVALDSVKAQIHTLEEAIAEDSEMKELCQMLRGIAKIVINGSSL